jgi:hypothetical protein
VFVDYLYSAANDVGGVIIVQFYPMTELKTKANGPFLILGSVLPDTDLGLTQHKTDTRFVTSRNDITSHFTSLRRY